MTIDPLASPQSQALQGQEPASVRTGSPAVKQAYGEALDFESVLVNQLCESLLSSSGLGSSNGLGGGASGGVSGFASLLPGALSSAIMSDGGLGLASQMLPSFEQASGSATASATGTAGT